MMQSFKMKLNGKNSQAFFRHLKHKLWPKEGPRVKLAIWLPTTKSRESTSSWCLIWDCDTALESSRRELQLCFRHRCDQTLDFAVGKYRHPKFRDSNLGQFRDSNLGVPRKIAIWMPPPWRATEYIIRGKVVASPSPSRGESCVSVLPVARPSTKGAPTMH